MPHSFHSVKNCSSNASSFAISVFERTKPRMSMFWATRLGFTDFGSGTYL